jgi:hypothetical protein
MSEPNVAEVLGNVAASLVRVEASLADALAHRCPLTERLEIIEAERRAEKVEREEEKVRMRRERWKDRIVCGAVGGVVGAFLALSL